jgi:hypothetical protein
MLVLLNFRVVCLAGCDPGVLSGGVLVAPVFLDDLRAGAIVPDDQLARVWLCHELE